MDATGDVSATGGKALEPSYEHCSRRGRFDIIVSMHTTPRLRPLGFALLAVIWAACSASGDHTDFGDDDGSTGEGGSGQSSGSMTSGEGGDLVLAGSSDASTTSASVGSGGGGAGDACSQPLDPGDPSPDVCGDGLDNDLDGFVDEDCMCSVGQTQPCFGGPPAWLNQPNCTKGTQTCKGGGEFTGWGACEGWACGPVTPPEICDNGVDDDCDGLIDEGCELNVTVNIDGDCIWVYCPPQAPYPVGCNINMDGGDSRGCVASTPMGSGVYFKEGDKCPLGLPFEDAGHVSGTLTCSTVPGPGLNAQNCPINKNDKFYPADPSGCPQ